MRKFKDYLNFDSRRTFEDINTRLRKPVFGIIINKFLISGIDGLQCNVELEADVATNHTMTDLYKWLRKEGMLDGDAVSAEFNKNFNEFVESVCKPVAFYIARCRAIDVMRDWGHHRVSYLEDNRNTISRCPLPEQQAIRQECVEHVQVALQSLSDRERNVVMLWFFEGLSHKEIADIMDASSERAIISLKQRAQKKLKKSLLKLVV
jgi:RNA polymerase sigma factor (sigma-70 family)